MGCLPRLRISFRFLLLVIVASGVSLIFLMLNTEKRNPTGGRSREDDILTRRHVASLQNVQNKMSSDVAAVVGQDKDGENGTEKRVIDPELKEAMERLDKTLQDQRKSKQKNPDLPEALEILRSAFGPVNRVSQNEKSLEKEAMQKLEQQIRLQAQVCNKILPIDTKNKKILILARKHSGLKVLSEAFGNRHGVFVHVDPLDEGLDRADEDPRFIESILYRLDNLSRCVTRPDNFDAFKKYDRKTISQNDFLRRSCQSRDKDDSVCVTSVTLLSEMCQKFPEKIVTSSAMSMQVARQLMVANPTLTVLYLFRDPRAIAHTRSRQTKDFDFSFQSKELCQSIQSDLEEIDKVRRSPKLSTRFHFLRYEDIALQPETELSKIISDLGNRKSDVGENLFCRQSVDDLNRKVDWNFDKNDVERVNVWKQKLSMENINEIEEQCLNVLSKLEYHIIGKGD